jgi:hypothetical protein
MYSFRSAVAHGGLPDFSKGNLAVLHSEGAAIQFLREVVRSLIRGAFVEPDFYRDLKIC